MGKKPAFQRKAIVMLSLCFVLVILGHLCPENIKVPVNIQSSGNIELQIASIEKNIKTELCLNVKVLIINHTDTVVSFFEDWNSWGWYNIKFKIKTIDTTWFINKKDRDWPKNFPSYKTLFPGDTMELKYLFGYGSCNSSQFDNLLFEHSKKTVSFQVFYKLDKARFVGSSHPDSLLDYHFIHTRIYQKGPQLMIDSLKPPIQVIQILATTQLKSKEYTFSN